MYNIHGGNIDLAIKPMTIYELLIVCVSNYISNSILNIFKQLLVETLTDHVPLNGWFLMTQTINMECYPACGSPPGVMMADTLSFNAKIGVVDFWV